MVLLTSSLMQGPALGRQIARRILKNFVLQYSHVRRLVLTALGLCIVIEIGQVLDSAGHNLSDFYDFRLQLQECCASLVRDFVTRSTCAAEAVLAALMFAQSTTNQRCH